MNRIVSSLACFSLPACMLSASPIAYVGMETGSNVENWSNPAVPKTQDVNGNDRFGGAGYYQIMPSTGTETAVLNALPGNDLGVSLDLSGAALGTLNTVSFTPAFLSGVPVGGIGEFINTPDFPLYSDASGNSQLRQGSIWLFTSQDQGTMPGAVTGYWNKAFSFTLSAAAGFRLGVAVDAMSSSGAAADIVSINKAGGADVFSAFLEPDGSSDMVFFDIEGNVGDEFEVKLWQSAAGRSAFSLITFDLLPTAQPTLSYTLDGGNIILSWELSFSGWILESSTDLGIGDDWNPIPDTDNNNSVTVPMAGVLKNFFRLKKSP